MFGIYIHVPFCEKKCRYCDFYSEELLKTRDASKVSNKSINPKTLSKFSDYLCREIEIRSKLLPIKQAVTSVFFGGGTPSLISSTHLNKILNCLNSHFEIMPDAEITVEANPGTVTLNKLKKFRDLGINRMSFGVQSFVQSELDFLERIHNPNDSVQAVHYAREAGFSNINIDIMFSIPGQTKDSLDYTISKALKLKPEHISAYSLIYEPGTPLFDDLMKGKVRKVSDDTDALFYSRIMSQIRVAGYLQYEVSNFAVNQQFRCNHNLTYWQGHDYISFGPSAHGFVNNIRYANFRSIDKYFAKIDENILPIEKTENLSLKEKFTETIFLSLRADGLNLDKIKISFGLDTKNRLEIAVQEYISTEHINISNNVIHLTKTGYLLCDEIILNILRKLD